MPMGDYIRVRGTKIRKGTVLIIIGVIGAIASLIWEILTGRGEGIIASIYATAFILLGFLWNLFIEMRRAMREEFKEMREEMGEGFDKHPKEIVKELRDLLEGAIRKR
ncbi:MAG: hypothetical protein QMD22_02320 [archaeon]|nr:hypothetical protein [archaeon]